MDRPTANRLIVRIRTVAINGELVLAQNFVGQWGGRLKLLYNFCTTDCDNSFVLRGKWEREGSPCCCCAQTTCGK